MFTQHIDIYCDHCHDAIVIDGKIRSGDFGHCHFADAGTIRLGRCECERTPHKKTKILQTAFFGSLGTMRIYSAGKIYGAFPYA